MNGFSVMRYLCILGQRINILEEEMKNHLKAPLKKVPLAPPPSGLPQTNALLQKRSLSMFDGEERE